MKTFRRQSGPGTSTLKIPFHDLRPNQGRIAPEIQRAVDRVLASGWYVLGPELERFEREFADYLGVPHAVGVASGTDAIELALRAAGIGPGDEVVSVSHTAIATICGIERSGARPVLVDVDRRTLTMCPRAAAAAITPRTMAILAVHLYGHPADVASLRALADRHSLLLVEDCAQSLGSRWDNALVGTFGHLAAFSFYPTKNLGAFGDAGAVVTREPDLAARLRRLRFYGMTDRDTCVERGLNSRLDELQAAILGVRLRHLDHSIAARRELAALYGQTLRSVTLPTEHPRALSTHHLFVVRHALRDSLRRFLTDRDIGTLIHYPVPVHCQKAYSDLAVKEGDLPETESAAREILSLPLYPGLEKSAVTRVADAVEEWAGRVVPGATP